MIDEGLTDAERATYQRDGFVRPDYRLPAALLARMRAALDELLEITRGTPPESIICPHVAELNGLPRAVTDPWLALCTLPAIVDKVASVLGPDLLLWGSQVFCKPAGTGLEVPWHQDGEYWPIRPLATCSVWIALDDVDAENGAMRYIPGSHRSRRLYPHHRSARTDLALNDELDADQFDASQALYDTLRAGELSMHDVYLVHGSSANRSRRRRAGFVARYMPASSHFDRALKADQKANAIPTRFAERPLYLLRGMDRTAKTHVMDLTRTAAG